MMLLAGTIPVKDMPLILGEARFQGDDLLVDGMAIPCTQGTGAMVSAYLKTAEYLKIEPPRVLLAGDTGQGRGSREIYEYLIDHIAELAPEVLTLHYWLPDTALMRRLCAAVVKCTKKPCLIADAASMYSAKVSGLAQFFDVFTPDAAELAFLADTDAQHPAYVKFMTCYDSDRVPDFINSASKNKNLAVLTLVKGTVDYIVKEGEITATVNEPDVPAMEAIGGTGDTITGMVSAFIAAGLEPVEAAVIAAKANRTAGEMADVTPATRIGKVIAAFPEVFKRYLREWSGDCINGGTEK